ncbi:hypothetical protein HDU92_008964 [Lobulomyces angularis]|nr:hypothetical protein HDU92_008964 [Lobulomyces angularis]
MKFVNYRTSHLTSLILLIVLLNLILWQTNKESSNKVTKFNKKFKIVESEKYIKVNETEQEDPWNFAKHCSIVYTWANGSIKEHQELYNKYKYNDTSLKMSFQRFRDNDELRHALRSYSKHMSWHRGNIFLVVPDGHIPHWINLKHPRLRIIFQSSIVDEEDNPTFNTNAIEQNFYRIPGISDQFIAINDDIFFGRDIEPQDFFTLDKGVNFFFGNIPIDLKKIYSHHVIASRQTTAKVLVNKYNITENIFATRHAPFVYHKAAFPILKEIFKQELKTTSTHKFRHVQDIVFPILHHYALMHEKKV